MSRTNRREFLKRAGAGLVGASALGSDPGMAQAPEVEVRDASGKKPPPQKPFVVSGIHGYADRQSCAPGETIAFHVSSTEKHRLSIRRLGLLVDDPASDEVLATFPESPPRPQAIHPGSHVLVEKGLPAGEPLKGLTLECWVRPWRIARRAALLGQIDWFDIHRGYGLFIEPDGNVMLSIRTGPENPADGAIELTTRGVEKAAGRWRHIAAVWDGNAASVWVDGKEVVRVPRKTPVFPGSPPIRLGAAGIRNEPSFFLDGDLACAAILSRARTADEIRRRFEERGLAPAEGDGVLAAWMFSEERGDLVKDTSPHGRHGRIVNHGTWMVGGPSFDANVPRFGGYDPAQDPRRGHGLRLAADDLYDCGWEATHRWIVPEGARPGFYVARVDFEKEGQPLVYLISFIVRKPEAKPRSPILLLAATNTWRAYGSTPFAVNQPGLRHVAGTGGMTNSFGDPPAYSFYRAHAAGQGTYQVGLLTPWPVAGPYIRYGDRTDYSHLARAERFAQVWLGESGYDHDLATDLDLHRDPNVLEGRRVLVINGHSEYWSIPMYEAVRRYLAAGGNVICLSGNSLFWRVSYNEAGTILECRKVDAPGEQLPPERRGECWHSHDGLRGGLLNECGFPGWKLIGLTTLGWNNQSDPAHYSPFIVEAPDHFLFQRPVPVGLKKGDPLGQAFDGDLPRANGHEVDVRVSTLRSILKQPIPAGAAHPEDPKGIALLAAGHAWPREAPKFDYFLRPVATDQPLGGEMIYWERPEGGRVFNAGSIGTGWALLADLKLQRLLGNVLHHFGVPRPE